MPRRLADGAATLREARDLFRFHWRDTDRLAEHDVRTVFGKTMRALAAAGMPSIAGRRVLDLGCGQRYALALQCAAAGADVTALDVNVVEPVAWPSAFVRTLRHDGLVRAMKSLVRRALFDARYYREIERVSGMPLRAQRSRVRFVAARADAAEYPLPPESFDVIVSNAVVEHVADVPRYAAEVRRMLVPGGYFCALIHNTFSLSGGHHRDWSFPAVPRTRRVPPWDHIRANRYPVPILLNKLMPDQYKDIFAKELTVLAFDALGPTFEPNEPEGAEFLTPDVAADLTAYPRDLLLTRWWRIVGRKG